MNALPRVSEARTVARTAGQSRVLIVKTSSLGDVVHTLPALTDAVRALPGIRFDWVVEEALAEIPRWHPAVDRVIPVAVRRWRKHIVRTVTTGEWRRFLAELKAREYLAVIDAQGLIKSALLTRLARGPRRGLHWTSAREPLAAAFYQRCYAVAKGQHAVARTRQLFALALGYPLPGGEPDFGLDQVRPTDLTGEDYLVFVHGTSWASKHWPESHWIDLARRVAAAGYRLRLPWYTPEELDRARTIAGACPGATVLPAMSLTELAGVLAGARAVVALDTGIAHIAAALGVPQVTLYGSTDPGRTGTWGPGQRLLQASFPCAPCLRRHCTFQGVAAVTPACHGTLPPRVVWRTLADLLQAGGGASVTRSAGLSSHVWPGLPAIVAAARASNAN